MRWLIGLLMLLASTSHAEAASYTLTWQQDAALVAENTRIERAPATGKACGTFAEIAQVVTTTLTYLDSTAPPGIVCYRVRNFDSLTGFSDFSNVAAAPRTTFTSRTRPGCSPIASFD